MTTLPSAVMAQGCADALVVTQTAIAFVCVIIHGINQNQNVKRLFNEVLVIMIFRRTLNLVRKSVCRLSSVTLLHPTQRVKIFGNVFAPSNSLGTRTDCIKILGKI